MTVETGSISSRFLRCDRFAAMTRLRLFVVDPGFKHWLVAFKRHNRFAQALSNARSNNK
jgi:hypothetical protein